MPTLIAIHRGKGPSSTNFLDICPERRSVVKNCKQIHCIKCIRRNLKWTCIWYQHQQITSIPRDASLIAIMSCTFTIIHTHFSFIINCNSFKRQMTHYNAVFSMTNMWDMHAFHGWKVIFQIKSQSVRFYFKTRSPPPPRPLLWTKIGQCRIHLCLCCRAIIDKNDWGRNGGETPVYTEWLRILSKLIWRIPQTLQHK